MSNLTFDHGLLKEHPPEPLEGHAVVVFERGGPRGEEFHSILLPGEAKPRWALPFWRRLMYFAYAADTAPERHLDFSERMRLADHESDFLVVVHLAYRVSDPRALVMARDLDPLQRVFDVVGVVIREEVGRLPWQAVREAFPQHARTLVEDCLESLREFAGTYGIFLRELRLSVLLPGALDARHQVDGSAPLDAKRVDTVNAPSERGSPYGMAELIRKYDRSQRVFLNHSLHAHEYDWDLHAILMVARQRLKSVMLGGSAPGQARPGDTILVQFAAYAAPFTQQVRQVLEREAAPGEIRMDVQTDCQWAIGTEVSVRCRANGLVVPRPVQRFVWNGRWRTVAFDVEVPADAAFESTVIVLEAFVRHELFMHDADAVQVAALRLRLQLTHGVPPDAKPQWVSGSAARKAFASYASQDRMDVLARVSSIARCTGMDIFVDRMSLRMGDEWEPALLSRILDSERFLLFWSDHAAQSVWVRREMDEAIAAHGESVLELHLLMHVPAERIPEHLRKFHFDDPYLQARDADRYRREHAGVPRGD